METNTKKSTTSSTEETQPKPTPEQRNKLDDTSRVNSTSGGGSEPKDPEKDK